VIWDWLLRPLRHRRRRRLLAEPFPAAWLPLVERLPFYRHLDDGGQARIRDDLRVLIAERTWEGCGGLALTDEMRVVIAAQASLLLLNLEHDYYSGVTAILVYPSAYRTGAVRGASGLVSEGQANLGETRMRGPVILAWDAALGGAVTASDGHNLVLHEFAHQLDLQDGLADGTPPIGDRRAFRTWVAVMTSEFQKLRAAAATGGATLLDHYGATNPAEFFAVATECFFERSAAMAQRHGELYAVLRDYYGQDPARQG
jgi:hypothetical protein